MTAREGDDPGLHQRKAMRNKRGMKNVMWKKVTKPKLCKTGKSRHRRTTRTGGVYLTMEGAGDKTTTTNPRAQGAQRILGLREYVENEDNVVRKKYILFV